ncbi:neutral zinc metallopeptidase [Nonomuraea sp. NPDC046802]|uniref:neutral zinc metallopeptidase n=1 Tax=Nonomuraea sp. NPDC046802 TaxID=3154919 RepID=UPI0033D721B4
MKRLSLTTAALAVALTAPLAGTAAAESAAYPVKDPKLNANPLYKAGTLPTTACEEPPVKKNDRKLARAYFDAVVACLETTWKKHLTDAGLPYQKVRVKHVDKFPKKYCGYTPEREDSQSWYCDKNRTMAVQIGKSWLKEPSDLWLFYIATSLYGYHVQNLVGIADAYDAVPYDTKAELHEQSRRYALQSDCFAGAFAKSVWPLKGRTAKDWNYLVSLVDGDGPDDERVLGKASSARAWIKRGFAGGDPGSCNTWAASSSKVA